MYPGPIASTYPAVVLASTTELLSVTESNSPNLRPLLQIVVINVEPQKAANPGYPTNKNIARVTRAFLISSFLTELRL